MSWLAEKHGQRYFELGVPLAYVGKSDKGWWKTWLSENASGQYAEDIRWHLQPRVHHSVGEAKRYAESLLAERISA